MSTTVTVASIKAKRETLKALRAQTKELMESLKADVAQARIDRAEAKRVRLAKAFERRENSIAKAKARLEKLLDKKNPVGAKAAKANRKPGKVTVVKASA